MLGIVILFNYLIIELYFLFVSVDEYIYIYLQTVILSIPNISIFLPGIVTCRILIQHKIQYSMDINNNPHTNIYCYGIESI